MTPDTDRRDRIVEAMRRAELDLMICALPSDVLLLTGYWPVIGDSIAIVTSEGESILIAPADEKPSARSAWCSTIEYYTAGSLDNISNPLDDVHPLLTRYATQLKFNAARIGVEDGPVSEPTSYIAMNLYMDSLRRRIQEIAPQARLVAADPILATLKSRLTSPEITRVQTASDLASKAYRVGWRALREGLTEIEAASQFEVELSINATNVEQIIRADGMISCMSGWRSATAFGAYAICSRKQISSQELILTHCNSQVAGYWTDVTRTYFLGEPDGISLRMYEAIQRARAAGFAAIRPGVKTKDIDRAVRESLTDAGFGDAFKHATGHGVGFAAIDHRAAPRLHPTSEDVLEEGMIFNVEPAIYLKDRGMRHCDMVLVTDAGYELLTDFHSTPAECIKG